VPEAGKSGGDGAGTQSGADSFIFIDDSAKECAEMEEAEPQVLTLELPTVEQQFPFPESCVGVRPPVITEEDCKRAASYAQSKEFGQAFHGAHSLQEFMASLELQVRIRAADESKSAAGRPAYAAHQSVQLHNGSPDGIGDPRFAGDASVSGSGCCGSIRRVRPHRRNHLETRPEALVVDSFLLTAAFWDACRAPDHGASGSAG